VILDHEQILSAEKKVGRRDVLVAAEDTTVQVTLQSTLLHCGADVLAVGKMGRCGLLPR